MFEGFLEFFQLYYSLLYCQIKKPSKDWIFFLCLYCTKLEHFFKTNSSSLIRALKRLCAKHRAFPKGKDGMCEYKCGLGFAKLFSGERIRKTETTVFEIRQGFWISSARRRGLGRNPRGLHFGFLAGRTKEKAHSNFYKLCVPCLIFYLEN